MSLKVTKSEVWSARMKDQPGGLARVLETLADAGASLECAIARRHGGKKGSALVFVTPLKGARVRKAAAKAGFRRSGRIATLRIEGPDRRGLGARIARAVGDAGINMRGVSAAVVGRKFVCYVGFDSAADATRAARAIKALDRRK